jgi:hypothetical protein
MNKLTPDEHRIMVDAIHDSATVVHKGRMMNERIRELAVQAGAGEWGDSVVPAMMNIEKFAALVAAYEREECAKVCEDAPEPDGLDLADRIRARGKA